MCFLLCGPGSGLKHIVRGAGNKEGLDGEHVWPNPQFQPRELNVRDGGSMKDRFRLCKPSLFKPAFLLSLLVILFLLNSFVFMTPDNLALADFIQSVNLFLSWPDILLEKLTHVAAGWIITAICIQISWFTVFYLALMFMSLFRSGKAAWKSI